MTAIPDLEMEISPLGGEIKCADYTVYVHIYRFARSASGWTLIVRNQCGSLRVWDTSFSNDKLAYYAFERAVLEEALGSALKGG